MRAVALEIRLRRHAGRPEASTLKEFDFVVASQLEIAVQLETFVRLRFVCLESGQGVELLGHRQVVEVWSFSHIAERRKPQTLADWL